jgi:hypothetical protein
MDASRLLAWSVCKASRGTEGRSPAVSGLTFTRRDTDEKKFPALCRS